MIKNKIDFKLINIALIMLIIFLMYQTGSLWIGIFDKVIKMIMPLFISFVLAYALYPLLCFFTKHKVPKGIGIAIIFVILLCIIIFFVFSVFPLLFEQLISLFNTIMTLLRNISVRYDLNISGLQSSLVNVFNSIILSLGKYVSNGAINIIGVSIQYITMVFIILSITVYFLLDMEKIRDEFKNFLIKKSRRAYRYVSLLDSQMKNYLSGFVKIMFISLIEYTLVYLIIGHPNAILLGFLALLSNLIPYFGGIITNILAAVTAIVVSPTLFLRTIIAFGILSIVDGYLINPLVYGKSNEVPPLVVIMSVFIGGILFGTIGIVISLPLAIIILTTIRYFKEDINDKIEDIKVNKKVKGSKV